MVLRRVRGVVLVLLALGTTGCVDNKPGVEGTTSLRVEMTEPTVFGDVDNRLSDTDRSVTFSVTALDAQGELDPTVNGDVDVFVHFLGSLTPKRGGFPLATVTMANGVSTATQLELPQAFGPTFLWAEDTGRDDASFALGTSPTLWYRNPFLEDVSRPPDEMALDALSASPLEEKQIEVTASRYGASGRMVITGVYAQGYTVSDSKCQDDAGTPPCVTGDYDHLFVFTFSRPEDGEGRRLQRGQVVAELRGAIGEFNGLTELNFPRSVIGDTTARPEIVPAPIVLQASWLSSRIEMERAEAALIALEDVTLCPLDEDFNTFKQWKVDVGLGCGNSINIITAGQVPDFAPAEHVGEVLPRVVGTLRPINIGSFNVWIMYPRDSDDITTP